MTWNYRVVRRVYHPTGEATFTIHEAYYKEGAEKPYSITVANVAPLSTDEEYDDPKDNDPIKSLRWTLERMLEALDKPVLDYADF